MKPCRKLLDVMYEQRSGFRLALDSFDKPLVGDQVDQVRAIRQAIASIDHIIDAYIETWQT